MMFEQGPEYRKYMAEKALNKKAELLTESLLHVMQIAPHDMSLVMLCGEAGDRTNRDAVRSWVRQQLCCLSCAEELDVSTMKAKLSKHIDNKTDRYSRF